MTHLIWDLQYNEWQKAFVLQSDARQGDTQAVCWGLRCCWSRLKVQKQHRDHQHTPKVGTSFQAELDTIQQQHADAREGDMATNPTVPLCNSKSSREKFSYIKKEKIQFRTLRFSKISLTRNKTVHWSLQSFSLSDCFVFFFLWRLLFIHYKALLWHVCTTTETLQF